MGVTIVKPYVLTVIAVAVLFYAGMEILSRPADQHQTEARKALRTPVVAGAVLPAEEQGFIRAVQQSQAAFQSAPNEMAAGGIRFQRRAAICQILPTMFVSDWAGRITTLESNSDGKGVLGISLADGISVKTWNNDISDIGDRTLIEPSSPLFAAVSQMKVGDQVLFSGTFLSPGNDVDCVKEASVSLRGSMSEPEFLFRFTVVREASERDVTNAAATLPAPEVAPTINDSPESVDATSFLATYQADERAANARYENKRVAITGVLSGVFVPSIDVSMRMAAKGIPAIPFVTMGGPHPNSAEETLLLPGVQAKSEESSFFGYRNAAAVADKLREGETVTLLCTCGKAFRESDTGKADYSVELDDCTLQNNPSDAPSHLSSETPPATVDWGGGASANESVVYDVGGAVSAPKAVFATYKNARFGFMIEYPQSFAARQPPENGDGITFVSPDGAASLVVAGGNSDGFTLREYYEMSLKSLGEQSQLGYRKIGGSWFVITWRDNHTIGYLKMFVGKGSQNSFTFTFPESQRAQYDAVTSRMEKSFRPGQLDEAR